MRLHLALPLLGALIAIGCGAVIATLNPRERANQVGALFMASVAWWAGCEVLWKQAADAASALLWCRAGAPGYIFVGAHIAWLFSALHERGLSRLSRLFPLLYAVNAVFLGLTWSGDLVVAEMQRTQWGWAPIPGPLLSLWFAQTAAALVFGLFEWVRAVRAEGEAVDGARATWIAIAGLLAAGAAGVSNVLFASLQLDVPRVASFVVAMSGPAMLGALMWTGLSRINAAGLARHVFGILPDGVALVRPSGRIRVCNPSMRSLLECEDETLAGRFLSEHLSLPVLEPQVEYRAHECELLKASGFTIPVSVSTAPIHTAGGERDVLVIVRDLHEVTALRQRLQTSERLAAIGQLAGGIAHEINNPLAFVRSNLNHLQRESTSLAEVMAQRPASEGAKERISEWTEVIVEALEGIDRAMQIVRDVSTFAHSGGDAHQEVDLSKLIEEVLGIATLGLEPGVRVCCPAFGPGGLEVEGAPARLKQLFLNLLVNAVRAVGDAGEVSIEARREGRQVIVTVSDDGCGIPRETLDRIFDPFYTTWPLGTGPGLGLAVCYEIVRSHGGTLEIASYPDRGTRVEVALPARAAES